ncbi:hypothetical protein [Angustibacter sp. Root456]|uniref:hypothetical protein n=1 Tax=Angustibacter sp. Root456 TaxID=1736539 RepID=UPI0006F4C668|nr:hypothetical protein [Angustibacter sp. Root456]KQX61806.1 hypothetical protein ASD06_14640 [Angustibacter sp. Root456]
MSGADDPPPVAAEAPADHAEARVVRWVAPVFAVCSVALLPWVAVLAVSLPHRAVSHHYALAWAGYDVGLAAALAATAVAAVRRSRLLPVAASAAGALLLADAWFDVVTSAPGRAVLESLAMAVLVELPLAALCGWLAVHSQEVTEQRLVLLRRRVRRH